MGGRIVGDTTRAFHELLQEHLGAPAFPSAQEAAQHFVDNVFERFSESLVLLRLFLTVRQDQLSESDQAFVAAKVRDTVHARFLHPDTPVFTLLGTRGAKPAWNDRRSSDHFRCIPLVSTSYVASLSMLSRQFECVGLDLDAIDHWASAVAARGRGDMFQGFLHVRNAQTDRDGQGRPIVPRQEFVVENGVRTVLGMGTGYASHPTLVTLFAFTNEDLPDPPMALLSSLLEAFVASTESLVRQGRLF